MHLRDLVFLIAGVVIGVIGIFGTIIWTIEVGVVALLVLGVLVLSLLVLQRRQMARVQQRTLALLNTRQLAGTLDKKVQREFASTRRETAISTKKIVGLLQAQQTGLDILNEKAERTLNQERP